MSTVTLTSDATSIPVGGSITYNIVIPLDQVPLFNGSGFDANGDPTVGFTFSFAYFQSGDGYGIPKQIISEFGGGDVTFTYLMPGTYTASAHAVINYHTMNCYLPHICKPDANAGGGIGSQVFDVTETITVVPEPATWMLMAIGLGLFAAWRKRWRS